MEISDLLSRLKGTDKEKPKPFLAIELTDEIVVAAVWQVEEGKTDVVSIGTPMDWNGDKEEVTELMTAADGTVSNAIEGLEIEPSDVIFGVAPNWANENGILPTKLTLIKHLCRELALKPLGFVVVTDSLLRYLKMQEGTPTTSLLVQVGRDTIVVTLVRLGKIEASETIGRGDDLASDVEEGISRFAEGSELPSNILVFDGMHNLEEEVQNLISYDWKSKFNFLHIPQIESLPKDIVIRSIAVAGGMEVAKAIGFEIAESPSSNDIAAGSPSPNIPDEEEFTEESNIAPAPDIGEILPEAAAVDFLSAEDFGFTPHKKLPPSHHHVAERIDLTKDMPIETAPQTQNSSESEVKVGGLLVEPEEEPTLSPNVEIPEDKEKSPRHTRMIFPKLPKIHLPRLRLPSVHFPSSNKLLLLGGAIVMLAVVFLLAAVWLIPKATVTVYVEPKDLDENVTVTLSTQVSAADPSNATIPGHIVEKVESGEDTVATSGKKTIGDPAKGEVTIYNRTSLTKKFAAGTILSANSLKFTLDDTVTVSSKSAGADYVDVPGKVSAKITAKVIGTESNLAGGTEFAIENFSKDTYVAKNDAALTGGSSQEVQVVDKSDKSQLQQSLLSKLQDQGKAELVSELGNGTGVYVLAKSSQITDESYSSDVGKEATSLNGSMTVSVKGMSYATQDVEKLAENALSESVPEGYTRTNDLPEVTLGDIKSESEDTVETSAKVTVHLIPQVDTSVIQQSLRGVSASNVESALTSVVGMKSAVVKITPLWLPPMFKRMPRNPANITVHIVPAN